MKKRTKEERFVALACATLAAFNLDKDYVVETLNFKFGHEFNVICTWDIDGIHHSKLVFSHAQIMKIINCSSPSEVIDVVIEMIF